MVGFILCIRKCGGIFQIHKTIQCLRVLHLVDIFSTVDTHLWFAVCVCTRPWVFFLEGIPSCPLSVDRHFSSGERAPSHDFACYLGLRTTSSSQIVIDLSFDSYALLRKNYMTCNPSYVLIIHNYRKLVYQTNTHSRIRILAGLLRDTIFKGKINE